MLYRRRQPVAATQIYGKMTEQTYETFKDEELYMTPVEEIDRKEILNRSTIKDSGKVAYYAMEKDGTSYKINFFDQDKVSITSMLLITSVPKNPLAGKEQLTTSYKHAIIMYERYLTNMANVREQKANEECDSKKENRNGTALERDRIEKSERERTELEREKTELERKMDLPEKIKHFKDQVEHYMNVTKRAAEEREEELKVSQLKNMNDMERKELSRLHKSISNMKRSLINGELHASQEELAKFRTEIAQLESDLSRAIAADGAPLKADPSPLPSSLPVGPLRSKEEEEKEWASIEKEWARIEAKRRENAEKRRAKSRAKNPAAFLDEMHETMPGAIPLLYKWDMPANTNTARQARKS